MKKTIFTFISALVLMLFVNQAFAQVPQGFNYQAVARNSVGVLLQNQSLGVKLSLHQGSAGGTVVYSERQTPTTNQFGLFTVTVGQGTLLSGAFNTIVWSSGNYWLQVELDVAGGTSYTNMGTSQLLTVPFAMYAASSGTGGATGPTGPTGATGAQGPQGIQGATGPLVVGTAGQTLRHNGTTWVATSNLYNDGTNIGIGTTAPLSRLHVTDGTYNINIGTSGGALSAFNTATTGTYLGWGTWAAIFNGNAIPNLGNTYDLGSSSYGFKDFYMTNKLFVNGNATPNSILGTTATGTLQWVNNAVGFSAYSSVTQSLPGNTQVTFDTEEFDDGGNFATNAFTAPVAGLYHFDAHARFAAYTSTGTYCWFALYVNGNNRKTTTGLTSTGVFGLQISADLKLAAGDVVKVYYSGPTLTTTDPFVMNTWFTGHKVY